MRDKFRTTLASIPKPKSGDPQINDYRGDWKYFKSLFFLKDQFTPRKSTGNFPKKGDENIDDEASQMSQDESDNDDVGEQAAEDDDTTQSSLPQLDCNSAPTPSSSRTSSCSTKRPKKNISKQGVGEALLKVEQRKLEYLEQKRNKKEEDDEDMNFFKSLLPHVKTLSAYDKLEYRMRIMKLTQDFLQRETTARDFYNATELNLNLSDPEHCSYNYL